MFLCQIARRAALAACSILIGSVGTADVFGQLPGIGTGVGGISIDADGTVHPVINKKRTEQLDKKRLAAAADEHLAADVNKASVLRKVSLVRLEAAYEPFAGQKRPIPPEIFYLAGLQRIDYLFVYPEQNDIVIAGPAEGFARNSLGRVVGVDSGRPPLRLDDLAVAIGSGMQGLHVGCSIDPAPENLQALQKYNAKAGRSPVPSGGAPARYREMSKILGMQRVKVFGVPDDSHFAQTLVEADYRMKRIALELEPSGVRGLRSHLSMLKSRGSAVQRWWLAPLYDALSTTEDHNAFELAGQRAQLMSRDEVVDQAGQRSDAAFTRVSTKKYAKHFTAKYSQLADKSPVFAELQNLIDLLIVAALVNKEGLAGKVGWEMSLFLDDARMIFPRGNRPRQVPSMANWRRVGSRRHVGLIGGGVMIRPAETLEAIEYSIDSKDRLKEVRGEALPRLSLENRHWWWD